MGKQDLVIIASLSGIMIGLRLLIYYFEKVIEKNYTDRNYTEHPACESFKEKIR